MLVFSTCRSKYNPVTSSYSFTPPTDDFVLIVQQTVANQGTTLSSYAMAYRVAAFITALYRTLPAEGLDIEAWLIHLELVADLTRKPYKVPKS